jgi:hypothetical protein
MGRNRGSAAGFSAGIRAALAAPGTDSVWLLDDDTVPRPGALSALVEQRVSLGEAARDTALLSYRTGLAYMAASLRFGPGAYPPSSSFLDFDLRALLRRRVTRRGVGGHDPAATAWVPYAPYGGLLAPRALIEAVGLPDERFVIYGDDTEFTGRFTAHGGGILLVRDSVVDDVSPSGLAAGPGSRRIPRWDAFAIADDWRVYYAMRNKLVIERRRATSRATFLMNGVILLSWLTVVGIAARRLPRLGVIARAIVDGLRGRLGETRRLPSP